jgi:Saxitoxin biosynthesis operon protein SxtJ
LFSINTHRDPSRKQLRSFGLIVAGGFLVIGVWPLLFRHQAPRKWALAITLISGLAGLLVPALLRRFYQVWMFLGDCLGWVNSRIILGGLFYIVVTPLGLLASMFGRDPMNRKFDPNAKTYRVLRKSRSSSHMTHQF